MDKIRKEKKISKKLYEYIKIILIITMLVLIFIIAPRLTEVTKNIIKFLYELEEEYITRFWTILLALSSTITAFFGNNKNNQK